MTKILNRRAVLSGASKLTAAAVAGAVPMAAEAAVAHLVRDEGVAGGQHPGAALERLWREWLMQLAVAQKCAEKFGAAERVYEHFRSTQPTAWQPECEERRSRGQKGPFKVHETRMVRHWNERHQCFIGKVEHRTQPYPGARSYQQAMDAANARHEAEVEALADACEALNDSLDYGDWFDQTRKLEEIEKQVAAIPAKTLFGVAVKAAATRQMWWQPPYAHALARPEVVERAGMDFVAYGADLRAGGVS